METEDVPYVFPSRQAPKEIWFKVKPQQESLPAYRYFYILPTSLSSSQESTCIVLCHSVTLEIWSDLLRIFYSRSLTVNARRSDSSGSKVTFLLGPGLQALLSATLSSRSEFVKAASRAFLTVG